MAFLHCFEVQQDRERAYFITKQMQRYLHVFCVRQYDFKREWKVVSPGWVVRIKPSLEIVESTLEGAMCHTLQVTCSYMYVLACRGLGQFPDIHGEASALVPSLYFNLLVEERLTNTALQPPH